MSKNRKPTVVIAYDFDGTLAPGNMQEHSFISNVGMKKEDFWAEVKKYAQKHDMDEILSYMYLMIKKANEANHPITKKAFQDHAKTIQFFPGVYDWFDRINQFGKEHGLNIEHYIISSGLREMVKATKIGSKFKYIFASGFMYDANNVAVWPALAVNYTTKTQYLFRVNKAIQNSYDNSLINKYVPETDRPIPFDRMIYLGDGETDIPCMKMLKYQGGYPIAVYNPDSKTKKGKQSKKLAEDLLQQHRADYALPADYSEGKKLDILIKSILEKIALECKMKGLEKA